MKRLLTILSTAALSALLLSASCSDNDKPGSGDGEYGDLAKVEYEADDESFTNPERGWYNHREFSFFNGDVPSALSASTVRQSRNQGYGLMLNIYYLQDYRAKDLDDAVLSVVRANLQALRDGGMKCVLRFAYTNSESQKPWDAPQAQVLAHIGQLKPVLQEYGDVIYTMEAGFVGVWGEWYYTDNFVYQPSGDEDYAPRRAVLDALLDALPDDRMICVRTPLFKLKCFGIGYADSLTAETGYKTTDLARIAGHNDCFLASGDDYGTFRNNAERDFWNKDTKYTVMGGETCGVSNYSVCNNAVPDMEKYHFSYLNRNYHTAVINSWKTDKCYDEVDKRLGYRLRLTAGYFPEKVKSGDRFEMVLKIANDGFAAPTNPRDVEIVFVNAVDDGEVHKVPLAEDPRYWFAGEEHTVEAAFDLPSGVAAGATYNLYLNLPDPKPTLAGNPDFSIRLANKGVWDAAKGYNKLCEITIE